MSLYQQVEERIRDAREALALRLSQTLPGQRNARSQSGDDHPSLSPPLVTLFVSSASPAQSEEAFRILKTSNTAFRVEPSRDDTISARFAGRTQHGIEGVERLAEGLLEFQRILLEPGEELKAEFERRYDPELKKRTEDELAEHMHTAQTELHRILRIHGDVND